MNKKQYMVPATDRVQLDSLDMIAVSANPWIGGGSGTIVDWEDPFGDFTIGAGTSGVTPWGGGIDFGFGIGAGTSDVTPWGGTMGDSDFGVGSGTSNVTPWGGTGGDSGFGTGSGTSNVTPWGGTGGGTGTGNTSVGAGTTNNGQYW